MLVIKDLMSSLWILNEINGTQHCSVIRFGFLISVIRFANAVWVQFVGVKNAHVLMEMFLPIEPGKPPENALDGSNGFIKSLMPKWPPIGKHPPPIPFFFLDFDDNLRFRVWIPSFFIVNGRFTYKWTREKTHIFSQVSNSFLFFFSAVKILWARSRITLFLFLTRYSSALQFRFSRNIFRFPSNCSFIFGLPSFQTQCSLLYCWLFCSLVWLFLSIHNNWMTTNRRRKSWRWRRRQWQWWRQSRKNAYCNLIFITLQRTFMTPHSFVTWLLLKKEEEKKHEKHARTHSNTLTVKCTHACCTHTHTEEESQKREIHTNHMPFFDVYYRRLVTHRHFDFHFLPFRG